MEKLSRHVSDSFETPSNLCAIVPRLKSRVVDGVAYFEFVTSAFAPTIRVEWPVDSEVALVEKDVAEAMVKHRWARHLTDEEAEVYNAAVDTYIAFTQVAAPVVEPVAFTQVAAPVVDPVAAPLVNPVAAPLVDPVAAPLVDPFAAFGVASPAKPDGVSSSRKSAAESSSKGRR